MVLRIAATAFAVLFAACVFYIVVSYTHAFWHRRLTTPIGNLVRAAFVEFGACLLLLPFWPLWLLVGASYEAVVEGERPALRRELGANSRAYVERVHDIDRIAERLLAIYAAL